MATDVIYLGPAPALEECAQVGSPDYQDRALRECRAYAEAIRKVLGPEPEGARLRVVRQEHDFGAYLEVVVEYDGTDEWAARYAARCDAEAPTTWAQAGMTAPHAVGRGRS
jgi:hypothetical protein